MISPVVSRQILAAWLRGGGGVKCIVGPPGDLDVSVPSTVRVVTERGAQSDSMMLHAQGPLSPVGIMARRFRYPYRQSFALTFLPAWLSVCCFLSSLLRCSAGPSFETALVRRAQAVVNTIEAEGKTETRAKLLKEAADVLKVGKAADSSAAASASAASGSREAAEPQLPPAKKQRAKAAKAAK